MIIWSSCLYIGDSVGKKYERIKKRLEKGKPIKNIFLVAEPSNEENLFDILDTKWLLFPYYQKRDLLVYGLARGKEEAEELAARMLEEVYRETGEFKVREYF